MRTSIVLAALAALALPTAALADAHGGMKMATAKMISDDKEDAGSVTLTQTPNGVLIEAHLKELPDGEHGFHIHETGKCDAPDFKSAGGHFNPTDAEHGLHVEGGPHAGDMPNIHFPEDGDKGLRFEVLNAMVSLEEGEEGYLLDEDGSAIMVHAGPDDYESQPSGDAGGRIACGVIEMGK